MPVSVDGPLPPPGTPILLAGKEIGEVRSGIEGLAMALFRLDGLAAVADAAAAWSSARRVSHPTSRLGQTSDATNFRVTCTLAEHAAERWARSGTL